MKQGFQRAFHRIIKIGGRKIGSSFSFGFISWARAISYSVGKLSNFKLPKNLTEPGGVGFAKNWAIFLMRQGIMFRALSNLFYGNKNK
jgi:hypothetical protein